MKKIKFIPSLIEEIKMGRKKKTFRLFDNKDLKKGDEVLIVNSKTGEVLGKARLVSVFLKTLDTLSEEDFDGHENYKSKAEMLAEFKGYYGDRVTLDVEVKVIEFEMK